MRKLQITAIGEPTDVSERGTHTGGVAPYALDPNNADRLWQISNELTQ
jgi:hypothetical protein